MFASFNPARQGEDEIVDIGVYRTWQDYQEGKIEKMDNIRRWRGVNKVTLVFILDGHKKPVKCADIWGFKLKKGFSVVIITLKNRLQW